MTPLSALNAFVCLLVVIGVLNRRRKRRHITLMASALTIDLAMVLYLELARGVVESVPSRPMSAVLVVHIGLSMLLLVLYGCQVVTGIKKARGGESRLHGQVMIWFLILRFGNLVTSFFVV